MGWLGMLAGRWIVRGSIDLDEVKRACQGDEGWVFAPCWRFGRLVTPLGWVRLCLVVFLGILPFPSSECPDRNIQQ